MFKVLIVEDEEMIRKGLRYTFDWIKSGCVIIDEASNGLEGLEKIKQLNPDIVILDVTMPVMDGITMLEKSIYDYQYKSIIISGYDEFEFAKSAIKLGVSEYLLKPLDHSQLFDALEKVKNQLRLKREIESIKENWVSPEELEILKINFIKSKPKISKHTINMIEYIENNYNKKISIQDLVELTERSDTYLSQKFKEDTSYTFNEFLNRYRIQKSIDLMKVGDVKIYIIAEEVGFSNYRYFISVFKKYAGCLPSDFLNYFNGIK